MVADWHALTTDYAERGRQMASATEEMVLCWLAAGIDPERSVLFSLAFPSTPSCT